MTEHTTHYDDCGCQSAKLAARVAELDAACDKLEAAENEAACARDAALARVAELEARANALRDALEKVCKDVRPPHDEWGAACNHCARPWDAHREGCIVAAALAEHPAASLAAHDAEVLERVALWLESCGGQSMDPDLASQLADSVRALAAQEVK